MPGGGGGKGGKGGGGASTVNVINSGTTTLDIVGLDDINTTTEIILPQPFKTESDSRNELAVTEPIVTQNTSNSRMELAVPEPIVTESKNTNHMSLDVRPLVIDACTKIEFGRLPSTRIRQPYQKHFGITFFGIEVMGFTMSGEEQIIIQDLPEKPKVVWGGEQVAPEPSGKRSGRHHQKSGRLRIRLEP